MKLVVTRTKVASQTEWSVSVEREDRTTDADHARWSAEDAERYKAALTAIRHAPDNADEIADAVLGDDRMDE